MKSKSVHKRSNKRSTKHSTKLSTKRSTKRSVKRSNKRSVKRSDYNIPHKMKYFYDITLKILSPENKSLLEINKDKNIIYGKASMKELKIMPWMFNVNPIWSSVPEPYTFELSFSQHSKGDEIQKMLSINNGTVFLVRNLNLNSLVKTK